MTGARTMSFLLSVLSGCLLATGFIWFENGAGVVGGLLPLGFGALAVAAAVVVWQR